jgi:hypothetical protein
LHICPAVFIPCYRCQRWDGLGTFTRQTWSDVLLIWISGPHFPGKRLGQCMKACRGTTCTAVYGRRNILIPNTGSANISRNRKDLHIFQQDNAVPRGLLLAHKMAPTAKVSDEFGSRVDKRLATTTIDDKMYLALTKECNITYFQS